MNSPDMLCVPMAALDYIAELEADNAKLREAIEIHKHKFTTHKEAACTAEDRELWAALRAAIVEHKFAFVKDVPAFKEILEAGDES
jgi:hypothetical protein